MRTFSRRCSALLILLLCVGAVFQQSSPVSADPTVYEPDTDPAVGFNLIAWSGNSGSSWTNAINALHAAGFREVSISPVRRFDNNTGTVLNVGYPSLAAVEAGVVRAKQLGMRVTLNPFVELSNLPPQAGGWRAHFAPLPGSAVANTFWPLYETYLDEVAAIAQNRQVDAMNVGTEMKGLDSFFAINDFDPATPGNQTSPSQAQLNQQQQYWDTVIDSVASIYDGPIGYAANWDNFSSSRVTNNIWSHPEISYIGIDSYFRFDENSGYPIPITQTNPIQTYPHESFVQLVANQWNERLDEQILPFAAGIGKPVVFTEQGYQHHNGTARNPQTEPQTGNPIPVDTAEQIMAFQGLLRALDGRQDEFRAMHIWQWEMTGSQGSTWNINPSASANQPDNRPLAQWLSGFVSNLQPGDYNDDAVIDAADYVIWRKAQGQPATFFSGADGDGSGVVDDADYNLWRSRFGGHAASEAALTSVPEPATTVMVLAALIGGFLCCRDRPFAPI